MLANDTEPTPPMKTCRHRFHAAGNGTVSKNDQGKLVYTPNAGYTGADTFKYTVSDKAPSPIFMVYRACSVRDGGHTDTAEADRDRRIRQ